MPKNKETAGAENMEQEIIEEAGGKAAQDKKIKKKNTKDESEKLQTELEDTKNQLLRTLAEYDNFRKRSQKEHESLYLDSKADALAKILPVLDNFDRASQNGKSSYEDFRKGVDMTVNQLLDILKGMDVEEFGEPGDTFDPNMHNAVMHIESTDAEENEIVDVFVKGYKMGERILRPATVKVAN